ncbi:glucoside xylosyltransferase 1 isoform X4 [Bactrocera oleae]|uniref:glucoside xylosyltransferase 1 isoform X4 n=1 Tax=Bactrocera oleae TaxID=104688 RepID=UPI00174DC9F6|nr:glucoside xylosyltransferase 1 isoform X4 [Bactrocera oleae]
MRIRIISVMFLLLIITCFYIVFNRNSLNFNTSVTNNTRSNKDWYAFISRSRQCYNIALVVCGHRLWESLVMIKSVLLFNKYDGSNLHFWIFSEDKLINEFVERLNDWRNLVHFDFDVLNLTFPQNHQKEWQFLFKPCSSQRLFLPFAALTSEHEDENMGWYNRFARHPYYGRMGVNSGVMLMNLTRMRIHNWVSHIVPIYNEYKLRITWGDQDIINIFFYYSPDALLLLPCQYNYRPDHCMYISVCNVSVEGIKLMHGNRGYFHSNKQPLFKAVYETVESYKIASNPYFNFVIPLKSSLNESVVKETNCGLLTEETMLFAKKIFRSYQSFLYY